VDALDVEGAQPFLDDLLELMSFDPDIDFAEKNLASEIAEGIQGTIYTHPIGYHGHAAGPTIGLWDQQGGVPGSGDFPMHNRTAYSIELNASSEVPEWKKMVKIIDGIK